MAWKPFAGNCIRAPWIVFSRRDAVKASEMTDATYQHGEEMEAGECLSLKRAVSGKDLIQGWVEAAESGDA